jgi:hypothetical protein
MASAVFNTIRLLEGAGLNFLVERTRPNSIRPSVTMVGKRVEIDL